MAVYNAEVGHVSGGDGELTPDRWEILEKLSNLLHITPSCVEHVLLNKEELELLSDYLEEV